MMQLTDKAATFIIQSEHAGFNMDTFALQNAICIVEEAGEFIKEYRRVSGMARKRGNFENMTMELADIIIAIQVFCQWMGIDIEQAVADKWKTVLTREQKEQ